MSESTLSQVERLDDFHAVRLLEHLSALIAEGLDSSIDELVAGAPPELVAGELSAAGTLTSADLEGSLPPRESAAVAHAILEALASRAETVPLVAEALATYRDDKMLALDILSLGAAVSMVIMACTTTFRFRGKKFMAAKTTASPKIVEAIGQVFGSVRKA